MFSTSFSQWTPLNIFIRIFAALILGCIIGLERGVKRRGAGTKTHTIVCLGSALVMLTAQYMEVAFPGKSDMARMAAQVISGVGFLGVGTIIVSGHQVKGLTTAASLWTCACIGVAVGIGFLSGGILVCLLMLFALHVLPIIEKKAYKHSKYFTLYLDIENNKAIPLLMETFRTEQILVDNFDVIKPKVKGQPFSIFATLIIPDIKKLDEYMDMVEHIKGVLSVEFL
ncbi:MAG: MgtC/SapB family protein [Roseburia sp.]|nr:MgtC/SapB family protein [Roseburia sp.]MCM1277411.1 MgtC/SapB family protein [Robinsoniella sp.]